MKPLDAVAGIAAEAAAADGADPLDEATRMALADGLAVPVVDADGFTVLHRDELSLVVRPTARGAGLGSRLLAGVEASYDGTLAAWSHGDHPAAARLAHRHGWRRVRDLWVMRRPMVEPLPPVEAPEGVVVRGYLPDDDVEVLRVNAAAFADHPEQGGMDAANLARRMAEPWFDPEGLLVAEAGGRLAGFHWTKQHDRHHGEVYVVGVDPTAQGRGLGKALTLVGLHHLARLGVQEVLLHVESDNAAAIAVYSRLGFVHDPADTHVQYRREPSA